ncbi:MAG: SRPBCC family protein [Anaerolineae bacterium]|nr:SRPBCC family protein [Anaerolineae bacterium]
MSYYVAESSAIIPAPADQVYAVLQDYAVEHHAIVPRKYFKKMEVIEGGIGAGTVFEITVEVLGISQDFRLTVSEPEPGRVLTETDEMAGITTTFIVDPVADGRQCRVTISQKARLSAGLKGLMERLFNPAITRRIFDAELRQLDEYMQNRQLV